MRPSSAKECHREGGWHTAPFEHLGNCTARNGYATRRYRVIPRCSRGRPFEHLGPPPQRPTTATVPARQDGEAPAAVVGHRCPLFESRLVILIWWAVSQ